MEDINFALLISRWQTSLLVSADVFGDWLSDAGGACVRGWSRDHVPRGQCTCGADRMPQPSTPAELPSRGWVGLREGPEQLGHLLGGPTRRHTWILVWNGKDSGQYARFRLTESRFVGRIEPM
jgi:hypothetical protein